MQNIGKLPQKEFPEPSASCSSYPPMVKSETPFAISSSISDAIRDTDGKMGTSPILGRDQELRRLSTCSTLLEVQKEALGVRKGELVGASQPTLCLNGSDHHFSFLQRKGNHLPESQRVSSDMASRRRLQFGV